jgi:ribosomal protein S27AE
MTRPQTIPPRQCPKCGLFFVAMWRHLERCGGARAIPG